MKVANIGEFKNNLNKFNVFAEQGEVVEIYKHNVPVARLIPFGSEKNGNFTLPGCGVGSVEIIGDLMGIRTASIKNWPQH
jgi:antitoxin (DNA-binding transcriptional repressor) of toxin-antitoxin stability system